ncbi:MAG: hypothetical protein JWR40_4260 [Massilia sp.]|jgi:hypothetical protein|nr:hypothetical protein [Massilia sp.]MDB5953063.1 hypothetical protein [Massilia sp.]
MFYGRWREPLPIQVKVVTMSESKKPNNLRTGLILAGVAVFFFAMVFIKRIWLS